MRVISEVILSDMQKENPVFLGRGSLLYAYDYGIMNC